MDVKQLKNTAKLVRIDVLDMAATAKTAHIASAFSCVEILVALYFDVMTPADQFILSKGHGCMSWYSVLSRAGIFPREWLKTYCQNGGKLAQHPSSTTPGIDVSTGSLGHGLSISAGICLGKQLNSSPGRGFVLLGDGECNEGSVWEAAMVASQQKLNNLIAIVDHNKFQATDRCDNIIDTKTLPKKWKACGWQVYKIDGHNIKKLVKTLNKQHKTKPTVIIADTVKGKGVSFMENDLVWHYKHPKDNYNEAKAEIIHA